MIGEEFPEGDACDISCHQRADRVAYRKLPWVSCLLICGAGKEAGDNTAHWSYQLITSGKKPPAMVVWVDDPTFIFAEEHRRRIKTLREIGFDSMSVNLCDSDVGAPCRRGFTVTFCWGKRTGIEVPRTIGSPTPRPVRASDNLLRDYLCPRRQFIKSERVDRVRTSQGSSGTLFGDPVYERGQCIPALPRIWVESERGCRRVSTEEWVQLKGYDKTHEQPSDIEAFLALPSVHLWCYIGDQLAILCGGSILPSISGKERQSKTPPSRLSESEQVEHQWEWSPPSFRKRGPWYRARIRNLRAACDTLDDPETAFTEGLKILDLHGKNYGEEGPKHLVLLWWEWPQEKWGELRDGLSMNFLEAPIPGLVQNAPMNPEELRTAIKFVDELIALGVLEEEPTPGNVVNNCPLFLVPKPGQPGQYRCIADMKKGGQNRVCAADPVQMTMPGDILPRLYRGGYSATLDIAKFFHMFPTVDSERPYMGCIHPGTGKMYRYKTLPMGSGNSPGASSRFGATFRRLVEETLPAFQGRPRQNDYASGFAGMGFDPDIGRGRVLMGEDGLPSCLIWLHVDDILLHGPTHAKCCEGLRQLLDLSIKLGFICQKVKTVPPCQCVKYCGFEYDTSDRPTLRIPADKRSRALAQVQYLLRPELKKCRFALAICVGNLQSLVPATPNNIGASFLRHTYNCLHGNLQAHYSNHLEFYSEDIPLTELARLDLEWWRQCLQVGLHATIQVRCSQYLGVAWGDGSGTGTGGTFEWIGADEGPLPILEAWMGVWTPLVHRFSSNWRELRTLLASLGRLREVAGHQLFYFTDNMVVYDVVRRGSSGSPGLHNLVQELKLLELILDCRLDVVHVPGTAMIQQGTDGQSRGLWITPLGHRHPNITAALFRPAPPSDALRQWAVATVQSSIPPSLFHWETDGSSWLTGPMRHGHTIWSLSPTIAKQGFLRAVHAWIESPWDSSHIFIVPRLLQRDYGRVNKNIIFIGQYYDLPLPLDFDPIVPFVLFYLPPFVRVAKGLDSPAWLDTGTRYRCPEWVRAQVEYLRGLSGGA